MPRYEDLTGQKFGRLTVIEPTEKKNKDGRRIWKCQCDCGNIKYTTCQNLKRGHCTSCGCKNKEQITELGHKNALNLIGKKYGKLTVIERSKYKLPYSDSVAWICKCDCGKIVITTTSALNSGNTQSCGCVKSKGELLIENFLKNNNIIYEKEKCNDGLLSKNGKPLRFDFYLTNYNCYIEFDGLQHYTKNRYSSKEQFERDCAKNEYCLNKGYKLYRIPYEEKNNILNWNKIEDLLNDNFLVKEIDHYHLNRE